MSTTATAFDVKTFLIGFLERAGGAFANDLSHIPSDKQAVCPMGAARPATEFAAECAGFNRFVARIIRGDNSPVPDEAARKAFYASIDTGEKAMEALKTSVEDLSTALKEASDEDLARECDMPWGEKATLFAAAHMAAVHMMYHDGQLNYIQSLYGDTENHWH